MQCAWTVKQQIVFPGSGWGQVRRCRLRFPTVRFASIAGVLLQRHELPQRANSGRKQVHKIPRSDGWHIDRKRCILYK
jgi:hypothetical protein